MPTNDEALDLDSLTLLLQQLVPLIGSVSLIVQMLTELFKKQKISLAPFQTDLDRLRASTAAAQAAVVAFQAEQAAGDDPPLGPDVD